MDKDSQPEGDTPTQITISHLLSGLGLFVDRVAKLAVQVLPLLFNMGVELLTDRAGGRVMTPQ